MKNARGFTLVEILVVVVIITVLATIGTLTYGGFQSQSRDSKRAANANVIADSLERYYEKNGEYPSIADVTSTNTAQVQSLLNISDTSALLMPNAPANTTNSIKSPAESVSPVIIAYDAKTANSANDTCQQAGGGCDSFTLRWKEESGDPKEINSRNKDRVGVLQKPPDPIMTASLVSNSVVGKVTHSGTTVCSFGTPQYKIISSTADITPDWSSTSWQSGDSKSIPSPTPSTEYFFYAIARCVSADGGEAENSYVAKDSFYYTLATMTASWSGATGVGTLTSATAAPLCQSGQTARFFIQSKVDTTSAAGQWLPAAESWTTTNNVQVANATNPRKISFRGQARCDNGATPGTPSQVSNIDYLISAPAQPSVTRAGQSGSWITWRWNAVTCPVGTTTIYDGSYEGNFPDKAPIGTVLQPDGVTIGNAYNNGYTYGFGVSARCGNASSKVLSTGKSTDVWQAGWPAETYVEKGKLFSNYSSGTAVNSAGVYIQNAVGGGGCESGSNRRIRVDMQKNGSGSDVGGWTHIGDYIWNPGAGNIQVDAPGSFAGNVPTNYEARIGFYCSNAYGGRPGFRLFDRYGTLHLVNNTDSNPKATRYVTNCEGPSITTFDTDSTTGLGNEWLHCQGGSWTGNPATSTPVRNANRWNAWQDSWQ